MGLTGRSPVAGSFDESAHAGRPAERGFREGLAHSPRLRRLRASLLQSAHPLRDQCRSEIGGSSQPKPYALTPAASETPREAGPQAPGDSGQVRRLVDSFASAVKEQGKVRMILRVMGNVLPRHDEVAVLGDGPPPLENEGSVQPRISSEKKTPHMG